MNGLDQEALVIYPILRGSNKTLLQSIAIKGRLPRNFPMHSDLATIDLSYDHFNEQKPYAFVDFANLASEHRFFGLPFNFVLQQIFVSSDQIGANEESISIFALAEAGLRRIHY